MACHKPIMLLKISHNPAVSSRISGATSKALKGTKNVSHANAAHDQQNDTASTSSTVSDTKKAGTQRYVNGIPRSILHDPDVDTSDLDGRWSEERDERFYKELLRGAGKQYMGGIEVDINDRRSWPKVGGVPNPETDPRIQPPRLLPKGTTAAEVAVFWHLPSTEALDMLLQPICEMTAMLQLGVDRKEVERYAKEAQHLRGSTQLQGLPARPPETSATKKRNTPEGNTEGSRSESIGPIKNLVEAVLNLRETLLEAYALDEESMRVFAPREVLDQHVGSYKDLGEHGLIDSPFMGLAQLPGDYPKPGGVDKVQRIARLKTLGEEYTPDEMLEYMDSIEAAHEARKGAGRAGSRGTSPRPEAFDPWAWRRERRRVEASEKERNLERPWATLLNENGITAGFQLADGNVNKVDLQTDFDKKGASLSAGGSLLGRVPSSTKHSGLGSTEESSELAREDPEYFAMRQHLEGERDAWVAYKAKVEEHEGMPYEFGHLIPAARRASALKPGPRSRAWWRGKLLGPHDDDEEADQQLDQGSDKNAARNAGILHDTTSSLFSKGLGITPLLRVPPSTPTEREQIQREVVSGLVTGRSTSVLSGAKRDKGTCFRPGKEPVQPEYQISISAGDVLELNSVRLRRSSKGHQSTGLSSGHALLEELQSWVRRQTRYKCHTAHSSKESIACVITEDLEILSRLPCVKVSGVQLIVVSSNPTLTELVNSSVGGVHLHWGAVRLGWYRSGSSFKHESLRAGEPDPVSAAGNAGYVGGGSRKGSRTATEKMMVRRKMGDYGDVRYIGDEEPQSKEEQEMFDEFMSDLMRRSSGDEGEQGEEQEEEQEES
ncbi:hypothetical protein CEUSTIGMA_g1270.t1 [Chlamydomonas eustigma]|uniref:Uncharacterized protein n=1 Tax=Chlamydomonas eustigma TaxID=1157962 RepID=A0A250WSY9_9CHLO|nr:hypothetical protein CEUSTIGMA_g1270.t1 [Chlamydomonas eustigma]|eukprot:GAX73819.1 hypothetical protein CEUSTIGMA_g1270.t1 [Chlamydomonas eustigma]